MRRDPMGIPYDLPNQRDPVEHFLVIYGKAMCISGGIIYVLLIIMSLASIFARLLCSTSAMGEPVT